MHSGLVLAKADPRPIYLQIIEQVRQRIALGDCTAGHALPDGAIAAKAADQGAVARAAGQDRVWRELDRV